MRTALRLLSGILAAFSLAGSALALSPGERVDNFRLLDQSGKSHELYYLSDAKAVVLMSHDITWDNSSQNPANPDPARVVQWGEQTWDEMNVGWIRYRDADEADAAETGPDGRTARHTANRRGTDAN